MPAEFSGADDDRFEVKPTAESHFSWLRTRLSVERTLMSWVRFGFTKAKVYVTLAF